MGSKSLTPNRITYSVPDAVKELYYRFNIVRIVNGQTLEEAITQLVRAEVARAEQTLKTHWVRWDQFEKEMSAAGFPVNRVTMWKYADREPFKQFVKTDGVNTLWDIDSFLQHYRGE